MVIPHGIPFWVWDFLDCTRNVQKVDIMCEELTAWLHQRKLRVCLDLVVASIYDEHVAATKFTTQVDHT